MSIALEVFLLVIGFTLTIKGSDVFVDTATRIATAARIPKFIIGATLVSVATTLPEIFVSLFASLQGSPSMAFGTSVGSVIANLCVMIALSFIYMPTIFKRLDYVHESILIHILHKPFNFRVISNSCHGNIHYGCKYEHMQTHPANHIAFTYKTEHIRNCYVTIHNF